MGFKHGPWTMDDGPWTMVICRLSGVLAFLFLLLGFESSQSFSTQPTRWDVVFGGKGGAPGEFGEEFYLDIDCAGYLYVSDVRNRRLQIFDPDGALLRMIVPSEEGVFRFERLGDIAVGWDGCLFVVDRQAVAALHVTRGTFYVYTPIIHRFDAEGMYQGFVVVDSLEASRGLDGKISPAFDEEGASAFVITSDDYDRPLHLAVAPDGDLYVLDEMRNRIYRYPKDSDRRVILGRLSQMDGGRDLTVDEEGRIYVADQGNHRVIQFDRNGRMIRAIGREGRQRGEFVAPYLLAIVRGRLLVKDVSKFKKTTESYLERRALDPSPWIQGDENEQRDAPPGEMGRKRYSQRLERIQVFDEDGQFLKTTLLRFDEGAVDERSLRLIGIDRMGGLYFFDEETHRIRVLSADLEGFRWSDVHKTYSLRIETQLDSTNLDASRDIDRDSDYLAGGDVRSILQSLRLTYDWTEGLRISWEGRTLMLGAHRTQFFPGEELPKDLPDDPTRFRNDYFLIDDVIQGAMRLGMTRVLDPDPYTYREMDWTLEVGGTTYDFRYETFSPDNQAHALQDLWGWNVSLEMDWDIRRDVDLSFRVAYDSPGSFLNYRYWYWDEDGDLTTTLSTWGQKWTAMVGINAVF